MLCSYPILGTARSRLRHQRERIGKAALDRAIPLEVKGVYAGGLAVLGHPCSVVGRLLGPCSRQNTPFLYPLPLLQHLPAHFSLLIAAAHVYRALVYSTHA